MLVFCYVFRHLGRVWSLQSLYQADDSVWYRLLMVFDGSLLRLPGQRTAFWTPWVSHAAPFAPTFQPSFATAWAILGQGAAYLELILGHPRSAGPYFWQVGHDFHQVARYAQKNVEKHNILPPKNDPSPNMLVSWSLLLLPGHTATTSSTDLFVPDLHFKPLSCALQTHLAAHRKTGEANTRPMLGHVGLQSGRS